MEKFKLLVFDIDGSLLVPGCPPPETTVRDITILQQNGIHTTVGSGRGYPRIMKNIAPIKPNCPLICEDGGLLANHLDGSILVSHPLVAQYINTLKPVFESGDVFLAAFLPLGQSQYIFYSDSTKESSEFIASLSKPYSQSLCSQHYPVTEWPKFLLEATSTHKCVKISIKPKELKSLRFPEGIEQSLNEGIHNVNPPGINKGTGVLDLAERLHIHLSEVVVIGNDYNDIPMFKLPVGAKVVVGNTCPDLLKFGGSAYIATTPNEISPILHTIFPSVFDTKPFLLP